MALKGLGSKNSKLTNLFYVEKKTRRCHQHRWPTC